MNYNAHFPYSENRVAESIGLSPTLFKKIRAKLAVDVDWEKNGHSDIRLSKSGLKKIWRAAAIRPCDVDLRNCLAIQEKNGSAIRLGNATHPIPETMRVLTVCLNPSMLQCADSRGERRLVWCGRNQHFTVGMEIDVVPGNAESVFRYYGRLPIRTFGAKEWNTFYRERHAMIK